MTDTEATGSATCRKVCRCSWWSVLSAAALMIAPRGTAGADEARPLMRDFMGINGHTVQFKPELYQPVCRLVRDYHPVVWDLDNTTQELPGFPLAKNGVDWSKVYGAWLANGWTIDACLMFETVPQGNWSDVVADARAYGERFAREFGPAGKIPLLNSVEIGNEPGKWSDEDYSRVFKAMAEGVRAGGPKLKIATCNLITGKSGDYEKSVSCVEKFPELFDVLTIHTYAQLENWPTWRRSFPEDPNLPHYLHDVEALCQWRDARAPGKPVWVTEFGYDSSTKPAEETGDFKRWVGVTDQQQAQWLVRSLLVFSAMPVRRAYVYFFNDEDRPGLHSSSGITRHFKPKPSFYALAHLQRVLGDCYFQRIVTNVPGRLRVQEYRNTVKGFVWAAWSPTGEGKRCIVTLDKTPGKLLDVQQMPFDVVDASLKPLPKQNQDGRINLSIDESPIYLLFERQ
jgi:hypothetical protein